jgi:hypothetical protein
MAAHSRIHRPGRAVRRWGRARLLRSVAGRWPVALAAVLAVVGTVIAGPLRTSLATTAGPSQLHAGAGKWLAGHTVFVGYYRALIGGRWVKVYCVSPAKRTPSHIRLSTVSRLSAVSPTVTRELAQTLAAHGNAGTAGQAEAVSQALNYEIGNRGAVARRAHSLSRRVQALAMSYVAEARRYRGGYQVALHLGAAPLPGQIGHGTVTVRGPGGGRSAAVRLTASANASVPAAVRTDRTGRASFTYRATGAGEARISAVATGLPPTTLRASAPSRSVQRMLSWSAPVSARASAHYRGQVGGFSQRYECSSTCAGNPVATLTACAAAGAYASRITYRSGTETHEVDFPAAARRACRSWQTTLHDRDLVTASWQFHTPSGWTAPAPAGGSVRVDCPPAPPVAIAVSYDCRSAGVTVTLGRQSDGRLIALRNDTTHRMVLVLDGARSARFTVAPGATAAPHSFAVECGDAAAISVRAGIQRSNGTYNYGQTVHVTLP